MAEVLELQAVTKNYSGIKALSDVSISFEKGKIHSIVGENGAGKSTMVQIITGAVMPTSGSVKFRDEMVTNMTPVKSKNMGIAAVYQELNLIPELKVYQNIFYGSEIKRGIVLDEKAMRDKAQEVLRTLNADINIDEEVKNLGMGSRQIIEIAKALIHQPHLILFDEPTASLPTQEAEILHEIIFKLARQDIAVIFVSHKLDEVLKLSDVISVLRDGKLIDTRYKNGSWEGIYSISSLVHQMIGKDIKVDIENHFQSDDKVESVLELRNLSTNKVHNINLTLHEGEILSLSGMLGSMRTEVLSAIFSVDRIEAGEIYIHGEKTVLGAPVDAIRSKIGYITEDRKDSGLFMELSIRKNMSIAALDRFKNGLSIDQKREEQEILDTLEELEVKYSSLDQKVKELSGGNQQKIAIGKWLLAKPKIILLDEPTRGVDVGAKEEIYKIISKLVNRGKSILMVSSETEEIVRLSDRTLVMNNGRIVSEYYRGDITADKILKDSSKFTVEV